MMSDEEWQKAEKRQPGKTYVEPELRPLHKDPSGRWAIACFVAALVVFAVMAIDALSSPVHAVCGGCYGSTPESRAEAGQRGKDELGSWGGFFYSTKPTLKAKDGNGGGGAGQKSQGQGNDNANGEVGHGKE